MAIRVMRFDGGTETVQANVAATATEAQVAFGPSSFLGNNVMVDITGIGTTNQRTTTTLGGVPSSALLDRTGNAAVACGTGLPTLQHTVALLSHNWRLVTLDHALANGLAGQTFNMVDCLHTIMNPQPPTSLPVHNLWARFNSDATVTLGNDSTPTVTPGTLSALETRALFSPTGLVAPLPEIAVTRAQIYELIVGTSRVFVILSHERETLSSGVIEQNVSLLISRP